MTNTTREVVGEERPPPEPPHHKAPSLRMTLFGKKSEVSAGVFHRPSWKVDKSETWGFKGAILEKAHTE